MPIHKRMGWCFTCCNRGWAGLCLCDNEVEGRCLVHTRSASALQLLCLFSDSLTTGPQSIDYDRHKAWHDPTNLRLQGLGDHLFEYAHREGCLVPGDGRYRAYYKAITGPDTAFDSSRPRRLSELPGT